MIILEVESPIGAVTEGGYSSKEMAEKDAKDFARQPFVTRARVLVDDEPVFDTEQGVAA